MVRLLLRSRAGWPFGFSLLLALASTAAAAAPTTSASTSPPSSSPNAASLLKVLGARAARTLAPATGDLVGLVALPPGSSGFGLELLAPGIARVRGGDALLAFSAAHPGLRVEFGPTVHPLLDVAGPVVGATAVRAAGGPDGTGVLVGVADTGLDVSHPDFLDASGKSRVEWILDLSMAPLGLHADLESKYGVYDSTGKLVAGAVLTGADIDRLLAQKAAVPQDEVGHGTHVSSIAAGGGGGTPYIGMAPGARLVFARVARDSTGAIDNDDLLRGTAFIFDRADSEAKAIAVNLSVGSDFGPHDGTSLWEQALAAYVGPDHPGHALVVAAGNSGSISDTPIHQSVGVSKGSVVRVPVTIFKSGPSDVATISGEVDVWVAMRAGADLKVGLEGPDGTWVDPVPTGQTQGKNTATYTAAVTNGDSSQDQTVPASSHGAIVVWQGTIATGGGYNIVLDGVGVADLYIEGDGDASIEGDHPATFTAGVREGTINLPATNASIIGVGCTVNRATWTSIDKTTQGLAVPLTDSSGGKPLISDGSVVLGGLHAGDVCWFSSAGPTLNGLPKPDISAPGGGVIAALSQQALPGGANSIFTSRCPVTSTGTSTRCLQIDAYHGVSQGTSMSSPMVAGSIALLFEKNAMLTQDQLLGLLQGGAHPFRGAAPFSDQGGPGELDVGGSLKALAQLGIAAASVPSRSASWLTPGATYVGADGSTPLTVIVELRQANGDPADGFDPARLAPRARVVGADAAFALPPLTRRAPGVWVYAVTPPSGLGGATLEVGATFDGVDVVAPKTVPIAVDVWRSEYSSSAGGGCRVARRPPSASPGASRESDTRGASVIALAIGFTRLFARRRRLRGR